jgi:carbohydrate-selective porin OprB
MLEAQCAMGCGPDRSGAKRSPRSAAHIQPTLVRSIDRLPDVLFLDWDGLCSALHEDGIDFRAGDISETATDIQGGDKELWRYADQWTFAATLDLQKLIGLDHAQLVDRRTSTLDSQIAAGVLYTGPFASRYARPNSAVGSPNPTEGRR